MIGIIGSGNNNDDSPTVTRTVTTTTSSTGQIDREPTSPSSGTSKPYGAIPGDGVFLVGEDIKPGTYRTEGKDNTLCYWARLSDTTGEAGDIIASGSAEGQTIVKIAPGDEAFQSSDCKPWKKIG